MYLTETLPMVLLQKELQAAAMRQKVIANNIANFNTPGFKRTEVVFEQRLKDALNRAGNSQAGQLHQVVNTEPVAIKIMDSSIRTDGNNVDIDNESINLAENGFRYQMAVKEVNYRLELLRLAITGRG